MGGVLPGEPEVGFGHVFRGRRRGRRSARLDREGQRGLVFPPPQNRGYRNVIVTWDWTPEAQAMASEAKVDLWSFQEIMREIAATIRHRCSYFTDDTLRTTNLFVRALAAVEAKEDQSETAASMPKAQSGNEGL